jgi:hypothetical protein
MDRPYIYVYDADALTDGAGYNDITVPTHIDGEFRLRRIAGLPVVAPTGTIQVRGDAGYRLFSAPCRVPSEQAVVPELVYKPGSAITLDLTNVLRSNNATGGLPCYFSQLAFQGVRRFSTGKPVETAYRYYEKPYAWSSNIVVNWSGRLAPGETIIAPGQQFNVPVQDYDFALYHIALTEQLVGLAPPFNAIQPCNQSIKLMLYDANREQLMSAPVCDFFLGTGSRNYNSLFPVPPLVYPAGSQILFDIHSLLRITTLPCNLQITFFGTRRIPC